MIDAQAAADAPTQAREHNDEIPFLDKPGREKPGAPDKAAGKAHKAGLDNPEPPEATGEKPQGAADRFQVMSDNSSPRTHQIAVRARREALRSKAQAILDNPNVPQMAKEKAQRALEMLEAISQPSPRHSD